MTGPVIALASDHAGYELKHYLLGVLEADGRQTLDLGTNGEESVDYPDFAERLALSLQRGEASRGVLVCGTGLGISIAANRHPWIRAAPCQDVTAARLARGHNDANVLALGARLVGRTTALDVLNAFLETPFEGGDRHARRIAKMSGERVT
ncbi:MAG TPA: ribose 5-phosphate isomerase B [Geminicoccaceae bacterium]